MKRVIPSGAYRLGGLALFLITGILPLAASGQFRELVDRVPSSANAVVILSLEKAKVSPMGVKLSWDKRIEEAFVSGLSRVPPQATRFVLASQLDFEVMEPIWEVAIVDMNASPSMDQILKRRGGTPDTIEGLPAAALPNDTCILQFGPQTLGAMAPANRQAVVRWVREIQSASRIPLSPYLQKAAGYSDEAGTEIIMAIDLDGVFPLERVVQYLKTKEESLKQWQTDLRSLAPVLQSLEGIRVGIRTGEKPFGKITVDFGESTEAMAAFAKPLLLQALADGGAKLDELEGWQAEVKGSTISLQGNLTPDGLRRILSLVNSPAPSHSVAKEPEGFVSPGETASKAQASLAHFHAVTAMADDLKKDMRDSKSLAQTQLWFDKYAKKIERLPMLNVDPELLDYSAYVADQLRAAAGSVRTMGIRSNVRESQTTSSAPAYYDENGYRYGYGYGYGYGYANPHTAARAELRAVGSERRQIRSQERGMMATDVQTMRADIIQKTAEIRRKMTERYKLEF